MDNVLRTVLNGTGLTYSMERDIVTISKVEQQGDKRSATGIVSDEEGSPLPGSLWLLSLLPVAETKVTW